MKRFFNDVKKYYDYSVRAAKSSLKTEVANSYLNWIWWVLDPLFNMLIYYLIFGVVFEAKEPNFTVFIFIGLTMWNFFNKNVVQSVNMVKRNKPIVTKVYIPKFILLITNMMMNGFRTMICWIIVLLMMLLSKVQITWLILWYIPIMMVLALVTFGCGTILLHFGVFVEDLSNVLRIVLQMLFYMTGVFYNIEQRLDAPYSTIILYGNPIALLAQDMRNVLLYQQPPHMLALLVWALIGFVLSLIGVRLIYRNENSYVKVI